MSVMHISEIWIRLTFVPVLFVQIDHFLARTTMRTNDYVGISNTSLWLLAFKRSQAVIITRYVYKSVL